MGFQLIHEKSMKGRYLYLLKVNVDGHRFITQALNDGAGAVLVKRE